MKFKRRPSVVISLPLHGHIVDDEVSFDERLLLSLFNNRRSVEINLVVDNQQWVVCIEHVVVDRHSIQVLLQQILEEEVFLLKRRLLFLNGQLV